MVPPHATRRQRALLALPELLIAVARQPDAARTVDSLHEPGAVDPPFRAPAPQIGRAGVPLLRQVEIRRPAAAAHRVRRGSRSHPRRPSAAARSRTPQAGCLAPTCAGCRRPRARFYPWRTARSTASGTTSEAIASTCSGDFGFVVAVLTAKITSPSNKVP